ncbi:MAG TPA: DMT family transporter [Acidobacteriota bacterium]
MNYPLTLEDQPKIPPGLILIIAVFSVSISAILIRFSISPPLIVALYRQLFCAVLFLPFAQRISWPSLERQQILLLILSGFFLALHFGSWIISLLYTSVARATLLVDLQPIWAAILAALFLKERLSRKEIFAILLVTAGGVLCVSKEILQSSPSLIGDALAVFGGIAGAAYFLIGRAMRSKISWTQYMFVVYKISAIWLLIINLLLVHKFPVPQQRDLFWIFLMALFPGILGHGLLNLSLRYFKTYVVNTALLLEPVLATIFAFLFFHEIPELNFYAGAVIVLMGLFLIFWQIRDYNDKTERRF